MFVGGGYNFFIGTPLQSHVASFSSTQKTNQSKQSYDFRNDFVIFCLRTKNQKLPPKKNHTIFGMTSLLLVRQRTSR